MSLSSLVDRARELDAGDELAAFRSQFVVADPALTYLDGNSLGRLTLAGRDAAFDCVQREWGERLVRAWNEGWYELPCVVGDQIAELIGAPSRSVIVSDSTTVNLYKLAHAALSARSTGDVVTDRGNFPSDLYVLQGLAKQLGRSLHIVDGEDLLAQSVQDIHDVALFCLSHVCFKSGYRYDMARWTAWAHERRALALWDLSHAAGAVPVDLEGCDVDLAIGCTYKFLNGGPGAPAYLYVAPRHQEALANPIQGWFGRDKPFTFETDYRPAPGLGKFMVGTPPILSLRPVEAGVRVLAEAGIDRLWRKAEALTSLMMDAVDELAGPHGAEVITPRQPERRGSQVSVRCPHALAVDHALIHDHGVIPDFRSPDVVRFGVCPLYTTFAEVVHAAAMLGEVLGSRSYLPYLEHQAAVT